MVVYRILIQVLIVGVYICRSNIKKEIQNTFQGYKITMFLSIWDDYINI